MLIDNVENGYDLRQLDKACPIQTYPMPGQGKKFSRQVAFAEEGKLIVGGSDHGRVYLFDRKTREPQGTLKHAEHGMVQMVEVRRTMRLVVSLN